jgi:predicted Rossmann fold nucleotide-binding protein DprA/Smf involved in DNA uptake
MRVAIVGSRAYPGEPTVRAYVRTLPPGTIVVSGGARGVDSWAEDEARIQGFTVIRLRPREVVIRSKGFAAAAHARNREIAEACDRLAAFSVGQSRGTASTVGYARELGRPVEVFEWPRVPDCGEDCLTCGSERRAAGTGEEEG